MSNSVSSALGGLSGEGAAAIDPDRRGAAMDLGTLFGRLKLAELQRVSPESLDALADRVQAAPEKLEAAKAAGAAPERIKAAELKFAQLQDAYTKAVRSETEWLALWYLYHFGKDAVQRLRPALDGVVSPTMSVSIPGLVTATLILDGPDDEPPF